MVAESIEELLSSSLELETEYEVGAVRRRGRGRGRGCRRVRVQVWGMFASVSEIGSNRRGGG